MFRKFILLILLTTSCACLHAEDGAPPRIGFLANAKEIFPPLLADPREVQTALRLVMPVGKTPQGQIAFGEYFGLYRWALPWPKSYLQWSIGGAGFPRFDLATIQKDFVVIDYLASMPVDLRVGRWSMRLLPYHISSHLGDDYILRTGQLPKKYTFDSFKQLLGYDVDHWRLYGGYNFIMRNEYIELGQWAVQSGVEWRSAWWWGRRAQTFFATDFQSWERVAWNPMSNTQVGVKIARSPTEPQALSLFLEMGTGHRPEGQFFMQQETRWVLGMRFDLI